MRTLRAVSMILAALHVTLLAQMPPPRSNPDTERALLYYRLGWEAVQSENWAEGVKQFQQAIDINKKFKLAYYGLGRSYMGLRRFKDAVTAYEACRSLYEMQASENFGNVLDADKMRQDDQQQLQIAINRLSSRNSQSQQTQTQIQQLKAQQQRIQQKRDAARDVSLDPNVPAFVSLALGSAYFRLEQFPEAEREYKAAIDDDPKAGEPHNNLAVVYMLTGRFDESSKEVVLAERAGFHVNPQFKKDLDERRKGKSKP